MQFDRWQSLPAMLFDVASGHAAQPFLVAKRNKVWEPIDYATAVARIRALAAALVAQGIRPGDRVALVSENRPEWIIADFAIMVAGAITVPAYTTNTVADHVHLLSNSGARAAIVSTPALMQRVTAAAAQLPDIAFLVAMAPEAGRQSPVPVLAWDELLAAGAALPDAADARIAAIGRDDVCCLIYTSGTGGVPKGVMLSHANLMANAEGAYRALLTLGVDREVFLSFLPMSHAYEHTAGTMFPISVAAQIWFAQAADTLAADMLDAKPTLMTAVPRLYETLYERIRRGVERQSPTKQKLFALALALGRKKALEPRSLTLWERVQDLVVDRLVRDKMRARFGGRLKALVSGGAPLNPDVGLFFTALGLRLLQGYGQTEASPVITVNTPLAPRLHTVGPPLHGVEVRIAADGEILVRGPNVMKGYWQDPEATARAVVDGWLHTGDVGHFDPDGYLIITDRKKDFIKNAGGDMIAPQRIEGLLTLEPLIAQAIVHGDRRPYLVALLVPDEERAKEWAAAHGKSQDLHQLVDDEAFRKAVGEAVARANAGSPSSERVRRWALVAEPFSVPNGLLTPTFKIRRHRIREVYGTTLQQLYD
ncbi:long-chain acyl-CoA synthetase [Stella humosa]|uniref:Long-chain acyl-CoA synthetase n=1 Tax=Stella humosa TaxID=94 RepID=A0A3N1KWC3_9PROT|nr:long-chain fatty acid--CoA ligase [Stella humosa]ROP83119.1 long-chain acyl-CoA synthetase [Stella humosa]BBK30104.1 AMP-dependent synthetase [Stella humosa]